MGLVGEGRLKVVAWLAALVVAGCAGGSSEEAPLTIVEPDVGIELPECEEGFAPQGDACVDIDECALKNGGCGDPAHVACVDQTGEAPLCEDVDECAVDNGGCGEPEVVRCVDQDGVAPRCEDVDECAVDNGGCGDPVFWICVNQLLGPPICEDVDECADGDEICGDPDAWDCVNVAGGEPDCVYDWAADWAVLTEGVGWIDLGGSVPSSLISHGDTAFPVILKDNRAAVVAARVGEGKAVHLGHESLFGAKLLGTDDTRRLIGNALEWMSPDGPPKVGLLESKTALESYLDGEGIEYADIGFGDLAGYDVVVTSSYSDWSEEEIAAFHGYLLGGGGALTGGHAWYWSYSNDNAAENHPGNKLLEPTGFVISGSSAGSGAYEVGDAAPSPLEHAGRALNAILAHMEGTANLSLEEQVIAADTVGHAVSQFPLSFTAYWDRVFLFLVKAPTVVPTASDPLVTAEEPLDRLVVDIESKLAQELPPGELTAHPAAADFPGSPLAGAEPVTRTLTIDASYESRSSFYAYSNPNSPVWRSTGLWVQAGTVVTITLPEQAAGEGLSALVGCHTDSLWHKEEIQRFPRLARVFAMESVITEVGSRFGGLLYIRVPGAVELGEIEVTIDGAIESPRYIHGVTTLEEWQEVQRNHPAPFAEIGSDRLILSVQSEEIRTLDDPTVVMDFWDMVQDSNADLEGTPHERERAERFAFDRQISAGWMHSGYPLMAHVTATTELLEVAAIEEGGAWGPFHELGHNHQYQPWVLPGTTEATCNLWSVYISQELLGLDLATSHPAINAASRQERIQAYVDSGKDFYAAWTVWTALETHLQLQEAFGWDLWTDTFTLYRGLAAQDTPSATQDKIDWFVVHTSTAANMDLTDFYVSWGFPISEWVPPMNSTLEPWTDHPMVGL
jgi:hypothetical protein